MDFLGEFKTADNHSQSSLSVLLNSSFYQLKGFVLGGPESVCGPECRPDSSDATHPSHANCQRGHVNEQHGQFCGGNAPSSGSKTASFRLQEEGGGGKGREGGRGEGGGMKRSVCLGEILTGLEKGGEGGRITRLVDVL